MKLPEPFDGKAVGRIRGTGVLVVVSAAPAPNVTVKALDGSWGPESRLRINVEPLTERARDILRAEVEAPGVKETVSVSSDGSGGVRRDRKPGGEQPK